MAENISDFELNAAREHQKQIVKHLNQLIRPGSALVIPTAPCVAPLLNEDATTLASFRSNTMALTCIAGLGGLPQVSMPVLTVNGCPVGVSLIGTPGSDEQLIELAARIS
jgi:amidase